MATKELNTRIQLKYDTYANWTTNNPVLKAGEVAIATITTGSTQEVNSVTAPQVLIKVGDGTSTYSVLPFVSAKAADVHSWAKKSEADFTTWLGNLKVYDNKTIFDFVDGLVGTVSDNLDDEIARATAAEAKALSDAKAYTDTEINKIVTGSGYATTSFVEDTVNTAIAGEVERADGAYDEKGAASTAESNAKSYTDTAKTALTTSINNALAEAKKYADDNDANTVTTVKGSGNYVNVSSDNAANPTYTVSLDEEATRALITEVAAVGVDYLGTVSAATGLSTTAGKGDFYRASAAFGDVHVGDVIIAEKNNPTQTIDGTNWTVIHCHVDTDTNTVTTVSGNGERVVVTETHDTTTDTVNYTINVNAYTQEETDEKLSKKLDKSGNDYSAEWTSTGLKITDGQSNNAETEFGLANGELTIVMDDGENRGTAYFMNTGEDETVAYESTVKSYVDSLDDELATIAKTGNVNDLVQTSGDVLIFNCGNSKF